MKPVARRIAVSVALLVAPFAAGLAGCQGFVESDDDIELGASSEKGELRCTDVLPAVDRLPELRSIEAAIHDGGLWTAAGIKPSDAPQRSTLIMREDWAPGQLAIYLIDARASRVVAAYRADDTLDHQQVLQSLVADEMGELAAVAAGAEPSEVLWHVASGQAVRSGIGDDNDYAAWLVGSARGALFPPAGTCASDPSLCPVDKAMAEVPGSEPLVKYVERGPQWPAGDKAQAVTLLSRPSNDSKALSLVQIDAEAEAVTSWFDGDVGIFVDTVATTVQISDSVVWTVLDDYNNIIIAVVGPRTPVPTPPSPVHPFATAQHYLQRATIAARGPACAY